MDHNVSVTWQHNDEVKIEVVDRGFDVPEKEFHFYVPDLYRGDTQGHETVVLANSVKLSPISKTTELPDQLAAVVAPTIQMLHLKPEAKINADTPLAKKQVISKLQD